MTTIIGGVPSGDSSTSTTAEVVVVDMASILTGARGRTRGVGGVGICEVINGKSG